LVVAAMLAVVAVIPLAQRADAAVPMCLGQKATIVGTADADVLNGTPGMDVIVGLGGGDRINGRGGNDLLCGGGGADTINGGAGRDRVKGGAGDDVVDGGGANDRLLGSGGNDTIHGRTGDDTINGGTGTDACFQDAGRGTIRNCESASPNPDPTPTPNPNPNPGPEPTPARADLAVTVTAPRKPVAGTATFTVRVRNNGPDAVRYTLTLRLATQRATCDPVDWTGSRSRPQLQAGTSDALAVTATCRKTGGGAKVRVTASVDAKGTDPVSTNDRSTGQARIR
jgi:Ca2+-binding RTX toxin-like protein